MREVHLGNTHWQNIPAFSTLWYGYNNNGPDEDGLLDLIMSEVKRIIAFDLTDRQREVMVLYFERRTQAQVAEQLGISQPTVSQHLVGKRRHGKSVGGALRKIRKAIIRNNRHGRSGSPEAMKTTTLAATLDQKISDQVAIGLLKDVLSDDLPRNPPKI